MDAAEQTEPDTALSGELPDLSNSTCGGAVAHSFAVVIISPEHNERIREAVHRMVCSCHDGDYLTLPFGTDPDNSDRKADDAQWPRSKIRRCDGHPLHVTTSSRMTGGVSSASRRQGNSSA